MKVIMWAFPYLEKIVRWVPFQICIQERLYCHQQATVVVALKDWVVGVILIHNFPQLNHHCLVDKFKMLLSHLTFPYLFYFSSVTHLWALKVILKPFEGRESR